VKAIVLAAGYATRLYPLTEHRPKMLLPVGGRLILDRIFDKLDEVAEIDAAHVVTNARFADVLGGWANGRRGRLAPVVHDDGTHSNDDRRGAIGDLQLVVERAGIDADDALVMAGDNLFDFSLADYVAYWRARGVASAVALYDCGSLELASQYGVAAIDDDGRIVDFLEKPSPSPTTLVATAAYLYHRDHLRLVTDYLAAGNSPDAPGNFIAWLYPREPVYGYRFAGEWFDIGDLEQLRVADNLLRVRAGLGARAEYEPDLLQT
jgi:glucose-1-phosphate thymidylyltransferase